jgi:hypothetical protein
MRQSICHALLVLALLVPLSRSSFGDTFAVSGYFEDFPGGGVCGDINLPSGAGIFGCGPWDWEESGSFTDGSVHSAGIGGQFAEGGWSFDGFTGGIFEETFQTNVFSFTVEDDKVTGIPVTWTGELYLFYDSTGPALFEIQMEGVGTASIGGFGEFASSLYGTADVTGVGQVVYEDPSVPEPSTLTLMGIAGIASILGMGLRRRYCNAN